MNISQISLEHVRSLAKFFYEKTKDNPCYRGLSEKIRDKTFRDGAIQDLYKKFQSEANLTEQKIGDELAESSLFTEMIRFEPNNPSDEMIRKHFVCKALQSKNKEVAPQSQAFFNWSVEFAVAMCSARFSSVKCNLDEFIDSVIPYEMQNLELTPIILREVIIDPKNAENKACFTIINYTESTFYICEKFQLFLNGRPIGDSKKFSVLPKDGQIAIFEYFGQTYISLRQEGGEEQHICVVEIDNRLLPFPSRKEDIPEIAPKSVSYIIEYLHQKYPSLSIPDRDICIEKIVYQYPFTPDPFEITFNHTGEAGTGRDTISFPETFTVNDLHETIHSLIPREMHDSMLTVIKQSIFDPENPGKIIRFEIVNYTETKFYISDECISDKLTILLNGIKIKQSPKLSLLPKNAQIVIFEHFGQIYLSWKQEGEEEKHVCVAELFDALTAFSSRKKDIKGVAGKSLPYITEQLKRKFPFDCIGTENISIEAVIHRKYVTYCPFKITFTYRGKTTDIFYTEESEFAGMNRHQFFTGNVPDIEKYPKSELKAAISELFEGTYENIEVISAKKNTEYTFRIDPDQKDCESYFNPQKHIFYDLVLKLDDKEKRLLIQNTSDNIYSGIQKYKTIEICSDTIVQRELHPATLPLLELIPTASRINKTPKITHQQLLIPDEILLRVDVLNFTEKKILFSEKLYLEIEGKSHTPFREKLLQGKGGQLIAFEYRKHLYLIFQSISIADRLKKALPYQMLTYSSESRSFIEVPKPKDLVHIEKKGAKFVLEELKSKFPHTVISPAEIEITKVYPAVFNRDFGWIVTGYEEEFITQNGFAIEYTYQGQDYSSEFRKKSTGYYQVRSKDVSNPGIFNSLYPKFIIQLHNFTNKTIEFKKNAITVNGVKLENCFGNSRIDFEDSVYVATEYYGSLYLWETEVPKVSEGYTLISKRLIGISERAGRLNYNEYDYKLLDEVAEKTRSFTLDTLQLKFPLKKIDRDEVKILRIKPQTFEDDSWGVPGRRKFDVAMLLPGFVVIFEYEGKRYRVHTIDGDHCKTIDLDFEPYPIEHPEEGLTCFE